jgi:hypothetical protein
MSPLANCLPLQVGRPFPRSNNVVRLAVFCLLLASLSKVSFAQNTKGLPEVGNGSAPASSQMLIDATAFTNAADMCDAIAQACAKLSATSTTYPSGATIDARGFTGNQVCKSSNITTMLFQCVPQGSSHGATGGKLLLGEVNLYADGPVPPATNYTDGTSGIGTPALIIPSNFWGIEGISRGVGDSGTTNGTWLSVCTGNGTPINNTNKAPNSPPCTNAFPQRNYAIGSTSVSGTNPTTMNITVSPAVTAYVGELAMVKGSGATGNNGTFAIQSVTLIGGSTVQIGVVVPAGTAACTSGCGNLILGTPILGFGGSSTYNAATCFTSLCSGFGQHIKNLGFNCQGGGTQPSGDIEGCIGWQNLYAEEESGADTFIVSNYNFVGVDIHGGPKNGSQNFGPVLNAEIYTGRSNGNCNVGTTGIYIGDAEMRGFDGWTINNAAETGGGPGCGGPEPTAGVLMDAMNTEVRNGHCEGFDNCVLIGANNGSASGIHVSGVSGGHPGNAGTNVVQISANNKTTNGNYVIERIRENAHNNGIADNINGVTLSDPFTALYAYAGIRAGAIRSGVSGNTDLAGQCKIGGPPTCSNIPFTQTYTSAPICTCSDTGATAAACNVQVTLGPPTTLTIVGMNCTPLTTSVSGGIERPSLAGAASPTERPLFGS